MIKWIVLFAGVAILTSCTSLTPDQVAAMTDVLNNALADGQLTVEQHAAAIAGLKGQSDWWTPLMQSGIEIGLAVVGALTGVRVWRGGVNSRKGAVPA